MLHSLSDTILDAEISVAKGKCVTKGVPEIFCDYPSVTQLLFHFRKIVIIWFLCILICVERNVFRLF